jgi:rhamnogalacturonan endolyase
MTRHDESCLWYEREVNFDASLISKDQYFKITIPAGPVNNGLVYDYIRLELADNNK